MRITMGDIWDEKYDAPEFRRVVPTNIGWKHDGENVMGRGVARDAARRYPELARRYGGVCQANAGRLSFLFWYENLILFPVKPLNLQQPHLSWRSAANLQLISESTRLLAKQDVDKQIVLPLVGCGNGGLDPSVVFPVLNWWLRSHRFLLILTPEGSRAVASFIARASFTDWIIGE